MSPPFFSFENHGIINYQLALCGATRELSLCNSGAFPDLVNVHNITIMFFNIRRLINENNNFRSIQL